MKGFKDSTRTVSGFKHWGGGSIGGGTGGTINRLAQGGTYPPNGNRTQGNSATQRTNPPTQELEEQGGRTPLISKFKAGGSAKHFHVHKHFHAKGGRTHTVSHSYSAAEKHAETYADGGHIHDSTQIPAGSPDYARGGKAKIDIKPKNRGALHRDMGIPEGQKIPKSRIEAKLARDKASGNTKGVKRDVFALNFRGKKHAEGGTINAPGNASRSGAARGMAGRSSAEQSTARHGTARMNAGGALYAPGGPVAPQMGAVPVGALGQLAARPRGLPVRPALPMRRPVGLPGVQPVMRAQGGSAKR